MEPLLKFVALQLSVFWTLFPDIVVFQKSVSWSSDQFRLVGVIYVSNDIITFHLYVLPPDIVFFHLKYGQNAIINVHITVSRLRYVVVKWLSSKTSLDIYVRAGLIDIDTCDQFVLKESNLPYPAPPIERVSCRGTFHRNNTRCSCQRGAANGCTEGSQKACVEVRRPPGIHKVGVANVSEAREDPRR